MDALERYTIEHSADGEPRLYLVSPVGRGSRLVWTDGDICVCGIKCERHWNSNGDWLGCTAAKEAK